MNRFNLNSAFHNTEGNILYHGSPIRINDQYMATGTFFTFDKEIAMEYGTIIYSIELDDRLATLFKPDSLREHLVNNRLIPLYIFNIEND